jgi:hypothetical protein
MSDRFVEVPHVPTPSPNVSDAVVMMRDGVTMLAYGAITGGRDHVAGVRFDDCVQVVAGGPNDEALHQHRWFSLGLRHYTIQVCSDSPWAREVLASRDKHGIAHDAHRYQHFVLALKDTTIDVLAASITHVDLAKEHPAWWQMARNLGNGT